VNAPRLPRLRFALAVVALLGLPALAAGQDRYLVEWDEVGAEAVDLLVDLVQIESVNPPGNESLVVDYLGEVLNAEGIAFETYEHEAGRANLVARYRGNGSKRPILIMGHTDVVGVQADKWTEPPFSGLSKDGYIWGRGTLDDKDNVTAGLIVLLLLHRLDVEMDRDIIFLAEAGEEGTPEVGIAFMVEQHWDTIAAEYAIAEGGSNQLVEGDVSVVGIETTEKVPRRATLVARGTAGHGSVPRTDNAILMLAEAVARAGRWETPVRLNETTRAYFERMASLAEGDEAFRYANVGNPEHQAEIDDWFREHDPRHYSMLRTSVVPTIIDGGFRRNVIPSTAEAMLDIRMLPDEDVDGFYADLEALIDNPAIEIVPERVYRPIAPPSGIDNEMFAVIEAVAERMYPAATTLPLMSTGATDMAQLRAKGVEAYGIGPARTLEEMNSRYGAHSDDERIAEEALVDMTRFLWNVVLEIGATR
jgi:acetylornithine deacetylase/succinyl-diaminopimelate desuccinylase-like protein